MLPQPSIVHFIGFRQLAVPVQALELCVQPVDFCRRQEVALVSDALELRRTHCIHPLDSGSLSPVKATWSVLLLALPVLLSIGTMASKGKQDEHCNHRTEGWNNDDGLW